MVDSAPAREGTREKLNPLLPKKETSLSMIEAENRAILTYRWKVGRV